MDEALLSRVEDAALNASAPVEQRWIDGWLVRTCPGKARRARSVQALAEGRLALDERIALAAAVYATAGLPMVVRITPFSRPAALDGELAGRGWVRFEPTRVMVRPALDDCGTSPLPAGVAWVELPADAYAEVVGGLRGSTPGERAAHARRIACSPVPYRGYALRRDGDGAWLCCGQFAREGALAGLYDVVTATGARGRGWGALLCRRLLALAAAQGATCAYLQVGEENRVARRLYERLGFADAYGYHYRSPSGPS